MKWVCKIWGFHGSDYEECRLLGYKHPVHTSQETEYISATELSQLMLCKIWCFHGGDYEECRLLGYTTPVRASQAKHHVSSTEPSRLMLCKIWGFHGGDYEECHVLGYYTRATRCNIQEDGIPHEMSCFCSAQLHKNLIYSHNLAGHRFRSLNDLILPATTWLSRCPMPKVAVGVSWGFVCYQSCSRLPLGLYSCPDKCTVARFP
jgi:hypothetical protein